MLLIKRIGEDIIPGNPQERLFLALAEDGGGKTVMAVGKTPGQGCLADTVGIYRMRSDGIGYEGYLYIEGHTHEKYNGLHYNDSINAEFLRSFPRQVEYVAFVPKEFADKTEDLKDITYLINMVLAPVVPKKKAN